MFNDRPVQDRPVLRSTAKMSLHDRFTQLRKIAPQPTQESPPRPPRDHVPPPPRIRSASEYYEPPPARPTRPPVMARLSVPPRFRDYSKIPRNLAVEAALKLKRRSIKQRLGVRQNNFRRNQSYGWRGARARRARYLGRFGNMQRWSYTRGTNGTIGRRRFGTWRRGGGRGGRGRRWGRGNMRPKMTKEELDKVKEELDKDMDNYMAQTKTALDREMDEYMSQRPTAIVDTTTATADTTAAVTTTETTADTTT